MFRKRLLLLLLLPFSFSSSSFSLFLLLWVHYPRSISRFLAAGLDTSLSCATGLQLTAYIFLMSFSTSSFYLALGRFWCKLARYIFLVFLALKRLVNKLERMWKRWGGGNYSYWVSLLWCAWAAQLYVTESLHPPGHPVNVAVLRDTMKGTPVPYRHLPVGAEKVWFNVAGVRAEIWNWSLFRTLRWLWRHHPQPKYTVLGPTASIHLSLIPVVLFFRHGV